MTIVVVVLAIGQLQIDTTLLNIVIAIFLIILGVAVALSLGLGTSDLARNIVYGAYVRNNFQLGMPITLKQYEGRIVEITAVNTLIESKDGSHITIPNSDLMNEVIVSTLRHSCMIALNSKNKGILNIWRISLVSIKFFFKQYK